MIKVKIFILLLCAAVFVPDQAHAQACKIDRLNVTKIKTLKPATGLTDLSTSLISQLVQEAITLPIGYAVAPAKGISRFAVNGYYSQKYAVKAGEIGFSQGVGELVEEVIGAIDSAVSDEDDLIFRISGKRVVPMFPYLKYFPMAKDAVYPFPVTGSFIDKGNVQIIEYDSGSMNDNLATFEFSDETSIDGARAPLNTDTITLFTAGFGDNRNNDDAIYELDYNIEPGAGELSEIPERLVCDFVECKDYREPITGYEFDISYITQDLVPKSCPAGYSLAGFVRAEGLFTDFVSYAVCEFRPHLDNGGCGATFFEVRSPTYTPERLEPGTTVTLKQNALPTQSVGNGIYLSSNAGQYLGVCNDCAFPGTYAHVLDPNRKNAQWRINQLDNGKYTLLAAKGGYLALCDGCVPDGVLKRAFPSAVSPDDPRAQFVIERAPGSSKQNDYTIGIDIDGVRHYLSACLDCEPVPRLGFRYAGTFHLTDPTNPFTHWELRFKLNDRKSALALSEDGDGVLSQDITISSSETWVVEFGETLTVPYGRTLTIEQGAQLANRGTIINEGTIKIGYSSSLSNNGALLNKEIILLDGGTLNNAGIVDNNLSNYFIHDGVITRDEFADALINDKGIIFDSFDKFIDRNSPNPTANTLSKGYYLGPNAAGKQSCQILGGEWDNENNNSCAVNNAWILEDQLLYIDSRVELVVNGVMDNKGSIYNDGNITNVNGNIRQCGVLDPDSSGSILNPVLECGVPTADQAQCENFGGNFNAAVTPQTCFLASGTIPQGSSLTISSGVAWYIQENRFLDNYGTINIEPGASLFLSSQLWNRADASDGDSPGTINNQGLLSVEVDGNTGLPGRIDNNGRINNPGLINNAGDIVGDFGEIQNICDGTYNVIPDWPTRNSPQASFGYDPEGEFHTVNGNNCSPFDTDEDGTPDVDDAFPYDPSESADSDGDGVGDNTDWAPNDPAETQNSDEDSVGDNADDFPLDSSETTDTDKDGLGDNADVFPNDPRETSDRDGDGVGDNADAFPDDPAEATDRDGDRIGDNVDLFPNDRANTRLMQVALKNGWTLGRGLFLQEDGEYPWTGSEPNGFRLPYAYASFTLFSEANGTEASITLTYPQPLNPQLKWWKYGRTRADEAQRWYVNEDAVISGNSVTIKIVDGALGDNDYTVNGVIVDTGALAMIDTDRDDMPDDYEDDNGLDKNAAADATGDADRDGLTNIEELFAGTSPQEPDTDSDGLSDFEELKQYRTNPLLADTDGDGVSDGDEIANGSDPTVNEADSPSPGNSIWLWKAALDKRRDS